MKKHYYDEERKNERVKKGNKNWNSLYEKSNSVYVVMNRRSSTMFVQQQRNLIPLPLPRKAPPALARPLLFGALPLAHSPSSSLRSLRFTKKNTHTKKIEVFHFHARCHLMFHLLVTDPHLLLNPSPFGISSVLSISKDILPQDTIIRSKAVLLTPKLYRLFWPPCFFL